MSASSLRGEVLRAVFLGESREYLLQLEGRETLRAATPPTERYDVGSSVQIALDPARCRILAR